MKTILIVEDSATTRALIRAVIDEIGEFETVEASSGFEALKMLPQQQYDLIITDINMPDINGLELISYVRNNPHYREIPLFIVSTEGGAKDMEKGLALGANEYLVKPFDPVRLLALIRQYLG